MTATSSPFAELAAAAAAVGATRSKNAKRDLLAAYLRELPPGDLAAANAEWQRRRDETLRQLAGLPVVRPAGAWSLLLDVATLGLDPRELSHRLLERKVAATPMVGWGGPIADRHVRFVFSNEPVERLATLGDRVRAALDGARSA